VDGGVSTCVDSNLGTGDNNGVRAGVGKGAARTLAKVSAGRWRKCRRIRGSRRGLGRGTAFRRGDCAGTGLGVGLGIGISVAAAWVIVKATAQVWGSNLAVEWAGW
jgi:hypothetical protein